jgi:hypothetical protein
MQKCDIDWPICSHEPTWREGGDRISSSIGEGTAFGLTSIRNVEEECHRHHFQKGGRVRVRVVIRLQVVAPSVRLSAIRKSANGGIPKRALSVANAADRKTKGAMILKI